MRFPCRCTVTSWLFLLFDVDGHTLVRGGMRNRISVVVHENVQRSILKMVGDKDKAPGNGHADLGKRHQKAPFRSNAHPIATVSYTHLRAHETRHDIVCRLLLEKKKTNRLIKLQLIIIIMKITIYKLII